MKTALVNLIFLVVFCQFCQINAAEAERVFHVNIKAPNASDKNLGTEAAPWKTLEHAGKTAVAGDKVVIHPGIYKGTLSVKNAGTKEKPIVFEGTELGKVILDGSESITGWKKSESDPRIWEADSKLKLRKHPFPHAYSKFYNSADPRDLNLDGAPLFFVKNLKLSPGCWSTNEKKNKLYVRLPNDGDPNKHDMSVITKMIGVELQNCFNREKKLYPQFITISNLHVRRFQGGMRIYGPHNTIENNIIEWCEMWGLLFNDSARDAVFKNNVVKWSGHMGAMGAHRVKFLNNKILFSNWKLSTPGWDASAIKTLNQLDVLYEGNEVAYNGSLGIWLDTKLQGAVIKDNIVHDNAGQGLEDEADFGNTWDGNVSYRNLIGFYCGNTSNDTIKNNIFADNAKGIHFRFDRGRGPMMKLLITPGKMEKRLNRWRLYNSEERIERWLKDFIKYCSPCHLVRDNLIEKNIFLNNGVEIQNNMAKNLSDLSEKYLISDNRFIDNVFINAKPTKVFAGHKSLDSFAEKSITCEMKNSLYMKKLEAEKLPAWAKSLYEKHRDRLDYPRSYMSIRNIYKTLAVQNQKTSIYPKYPAPAGLLALARICESEVLDKINFSDKMLHGYRIGLKGEPCIALWREHGSPSDFVPVLLKGVSEQSELETSWGAIIPIQRKGDLASINVGTWPLYLKNCSGTVTEVQPFTFKLPTIFPEGKSVRISIHSSIGDGELFIDPLYENVKCPRKIAIKNAIGSFELDLLKDDYGFVKLRLAGKLGGLYVGRTLQFSTKKQSVAAEDASQQAGFKPIPINKVTNCNLKADFPKELLQMKAGNSSIQGIPNEIKVGKITFKIDKDSVIGLSNSRVKEKRPAMLSVPMGNKKYSHLAFLQVLAYAPQEKGVDIFQYRLNYDDNFNASTSVKNKVNVFDWWNKLDERELDMMKRSGCYCAWSGDNGSGHTVYVYAYVWKNPEPQKGIVSINIGGGDPNKKNTMGVLAISGLEINK